MPWQKMGGYQSGRISVSVYLERLNIMATSRSETFTSNSRSEIGQTEHEYSVRSEVKLACSRRLPRMEITLGIPTIAVAPLCKS